MVIAIVLAAPITLVAVPLAAITTTARDVARWRRRHADAEARISRRRRRLP
jgi:hypothetical protein